MCPMWIIFIENRGAPLILDRFDRRSHVTYMMAEYKTKTGHTYRYFQD